MLIVNVNIIIIVRYVWRNALSLGYLYKCAFRWATIYSGLVDKGSAGRRATMSVSAHILVSYGEHTGIVWGAYGYKKLLAGSARIKFASTTKSRNYEIS